MSIKNRLLAAWTRDNHKAFADSIAEELDKTGQELNQKVSKSGDEITGELLVKLPPIKSQYAFPISIQGQYSEESLKLVWRIGMSTLTAIFYIKYANTLMVGLAEGLGLFPAKKGLTLGYKDAKWKTTFTTKLNNGEDIAIPTKGGTLALVSDIENTLRKYNLIPQETTPTEEKE